MPFRWYEKQNTGNLLELTLVGVTEGDPANPDHIITKPLQVSRVGDPKPPSTPLPPSILTGTMPSRTSSVITWAAADNTGRPPITSYNIYRSRDGAPEVYVDNVDLAPATWPSGIYGSSASLLESNRNRVSDLAQSYNLGTWTQIENPALPGIPFDKNFKTVLVMYMMPKSDPSITYAAVAAGTHDAHYQALATYLITQNRRDVIICWNHEFNLPNADCSVQASGLRSGGVERSAEFRDAWRHVVTVMRAVRVGGLGGNWQFMFNPSNGWSGGSSVTAAACYPGDSYVDHLWPDSYDRWDAHDGATTAARWTQILTGGSGYGLTWASAFARAGVARNTDTSTGSSPAQTSATKSLGLGLREWGMWDNLTVGAGGGGDNAEYFQNVYSWLRNHQSSATGGTPAGSVLPMVTTASSTDGTSYTSGSFTPAIGDLVVVMVSASGTVAPATVTSSTGQSFSLVTSVTKSSSADTISFYVATAFATTTTSRTVTYSWTGANATGATIAVAVVKGLADAGLLAVSQFASQSNRSTGTTPSPVFSAVPSTAHPIIGVVGNGTNPATITPPTGFTEQADVGYATPTNGLEWVSTDSGFNNSTLGWGATSGSGYGVIAVEFNTPAAGAVFGTVSGEILFDSDSSDGVFHDITTNGGFPYPLARASYLSLWSNKSTSDLTYTDTPLPTNTPEIVFGYIVRAVNSDGVGAPSSIRNVQWLGGPTSPPTAPTNLIRGQLTSSSVQLTWSATPDATVTKYGIYNANTLLVDNIDKASLSYTWNNLAPGTTYSSINVRRFNTAGWSGQSNTIQFTIPQPSTSQFFGHQPAKLYVGMTIGPQTNPPYNGTEPSWDTMVNNTIQHQVYADRIYQPSYTTKAQTDLTDVLAERRIPWVSSKPADISGSIPNSQAGWDSIAAGNFDTQIRTYFDSLLGITGFANGPIVWTFHHEPQQVGRTASHGTSFNNAFNRIIDLAKSRPTWNDKIIFAPNYMEFLWRSSDSRQIGGAVQNAWFPATALQRWDFFSFDMYPFQSSSNSTSPTDYQSVNPPMRIQRMKDSLNLYGYPDMLLGCAEFAGRHNIGGYVITAAQWVRSMMDYMSNDPRFWICCYFNSDGGVADESLMWGAEPGDTETQMDVFREKLSISARLADLV